MSKQIYRIEITRPFEISELLDWVKNYFNIKNNFKMVDYQYYPKLCHSYSLLEFNHWGWNVEAFESHKDFFGVVLYFNKEDDAMHFQLSMTGNTHA